MDIHIPEPDFSFEDLIKRKALGIISTYLSIGNFSNPYIDTLKMIQGKIQEELWELPESNYRLIFINEVLVHIVKLKGKFLEQRRSLNTTNQTHKTNYEQSERVTIDNINDMQFYLYRLLSEQGFKIDKNVFTYEEIRNAEKVVDDILDALNKLQLGQEVIFNFIDELKEDIASLKSDFTSGKKKWYQRAVGIIASYSGEKGADAIYDKLKPLLKHLWDQFVPMIEKLMQ